jgi:hypothetical protein
VSGNPAGRPTYGASAREWANVLADWSKSDLLSLIADDDAPSAKVAAARQVLAAREGDGHAFDRLADRTEGRPIAAVALLNSEEHRTPAEVIAHIRARIEERMGRKVGAAGPTSLMIDTGKEGE